MMSEISMGVESNMPEDVSAERFIERMESYRSAEELRKYQRYFKSGEGDYGEGDEFMGVRMGQVFELAKEFIAMVPGEIEKLLEVPIHEVRAGGLSIMDKQARGKKTPESRRKELYDLYMRKMDRINNWDLVDVSAPYVVGGYLFDKERDVLYELAQSENLWERRTAIISTYFFLKAGEVDDTFRMSEMLIGDGHDLIHKAVGGALRWAGDVDPQRLTGFLDKYAATMPRVMLRYTVEHLDKEERDRYMGVKKAG